MCHAARQITAGEETRIEVAMCKVFSATVVNDMFQMCGGNGIARGLPLEHFYKEVCRFRIFDGADEGHLRSIARTSLDDVDADEIRTATRF